METNRRSGFIRDLIIKIFLVLLFVFLITLLFPMPNLTPFYNRIFNDNVQTMKDAAEDYFTKDRMPKNVGDSSKLTLKQMLDKKLVLPFLDKDGNECDTDKSYVKVTKKKKEYELEVHLTCGNESNYVIEPIGCYNFCPDNSCQKEVTTDEATGKVVINKDNTTPSNKKVVPPTPNDPTPTPNDPTPTPDSDSKYKYQYLYTRTITNTKWVTGDWTTSKKTQTDDVKLVDTKVQYTGKKKVSKGTISYKHKKTETKDNWTYDNTWTDEVKTLTDRVKLYDTRTLYTGQKRYSVDTTKYKHIKYETKDNWTYDNTWTDEVKTETDRVKLYDTRTLYTGQRQYTVDTTQYKHIKYAYKDNWKETGYQETKYNTNDKVVLLGTRYVVRKTTKTTTGGWSAWVKDTTWRTSKPADTSTKQWSDAYNKKTITSEGARQFIKVVISDSNTLPAKVVQSDGSVIYNVFDHMGTETCLTGCTNGSKIVYYYNQYKAGVNVSYQYQYMYRTYSSSSTTDVDEKIVTDPTSYTKNGYTIVRYEYNYKINTPEKYISDTKWTDSKTSPSGYEYANEKKIVRTTKYENLNKWVTSESALGDYTYKIATKKQYKYKYNNPTSSVSTVWTDSKTSPAGYTYANEKITTRTYKYENLNKWVTSESALGEYTYKTTTKKQYKYKYNNPTTKDIIVWTDSIIPPAGFTYTGEYINNKTDSYVDLGKWVNSKSELGEYTHDVQTRTLYKYKTRKTTTITESKWFDYNPGGNWVYTGQSRKIKVK